MKLGVRISDLYGEAKFPIDIPEDNVTKEAILKAIEDNFDKVHEQIQCIFGGYVVVCKPSYLGEYWGREVARGGILYFIFGGHRISNFELKSCV